MFGKSITLFRLFGFDVRINLSWLFLALLISWSLAEGYFPALYEGWPTETYWWTAVFGVLGLLFSIVVHELSHSLVARTYGLPMGGITLFIFGGVAQMEQEPPSPKVEFLMSIAGPLSSIVLAAAFYGILVVFQLFVLPEPVIALAEYLTALNLILAVFNLLPAFPMDGGRALRAALWQFTGNLMWATRWASRIGSFFGILLIGMGVVWLIQGQFIGGIWWFLIGMFLRGAAQGSYYQLEVRQLLEGQTVRDFMTDSSSAVPPQMTVDKLVERKVYEHYQDQFAVVEDDRLIGCVGVNEIKTVAKDQWPHAIVGQIMVPCQDDRMIGPDAPALDVLARLSKLGSNWLIVAESGQFFGMISGRDLLKYISLKMDLGE